MIIITINNKDIKTKLHRKIIDHKDLQKYKKEYIICIQRPVNENQWHIEYVCKTIIRKSFKRL